MSVQFCIVYSVLYSVQAVQPSAYNILALAYSVSTVRWHGTPPCKGMSPFEMERVYSPWPRVSWWTFFNLNTVLVFTEWDLFCNFVAFHQSRVDEASRFQWVCQHIRSYLIITAISQARNVICDLFHFVVVSPVNVHWTLVHSCRRCNSIAILTDNMNCGQGLAAWDDLNALFQSANASYFFDVSAQAIVLSFITSKSHNFLCSRNERHYCTTHHYQAATHRLPVVISPGQSASTYTIGKSVPPGPPYL